MDFCTFFCTSELPSADGDRDTELMQFYHQKLCEQVYIQSQHSSAICMHFSHIHLTQIPEAATEYPFEHLVNDMKGMVLLFGSIIPAFGCSLLEGEQHFR